MRRREYRSCYSCDYSEIHVNGKDRTIVCYKSLRIYKPEPSKSYPEWCELEQMERSKR